ncbi:MAG: hypothetical protein MJ237_07175 [bacterium]|nr:hypothetical protein [bacterium]
MNLINQNSNIVMKSESGYPASVTVPSANSQISNVQAVSLPDMYYMADKYEKPKTFIEKLKKVDLFNIIVPWFEHPVLMLGTCFGISYAVDSFDKSCNKEYEKSIVGKAANFGDKIEQSKVVQNDISQKVLGGIKNGWTKTKQFFLKNDVIRAMVETPSEPLLSAPKEELKHTEGRLLDRFRELVFATNMYPQADKSGNAAYSKLGIKDLALNKEEISQLKKLYNVSSLKDIPSEELANRVMLQRLKYDESQIVSILHEANPTDAVARELRKVSGLTEEEFARVLDGTAEDAVELAKKASENLKPIKCMRGMVKIPNSPVQPFANESSFAEVYNRLHSITDGAKTNTGRFMSKFVQKLHRGFTFGGAKGGVLLFVAPLIVETLLNTRKADKKEKVSTFTGGLLNAVTWVFTFPIALKAIYAIGGMQFAGMGKENVEKYKKAISDFNATEFASKDAYKTAKEKLINYLKKLKGRETVGDQNLLTKMLRKIGGFTKRDLLMIKPYQSSEKSFMDFVRRIPYKFRDIGYSAMRFGIFMMVAFPLVEKILEKGIQSILGKPYDAMKEEDNKANKERQEQYTMADLKQRMMEIQYNKEHPQTIQEKAYQFIPQEKIEQDVSVDEEPAQDVTESAISNEEIIPAPQKEVVNQVVSDDAVKPIESKEPVNKNSQEIAALQMAPIVANQANIVDNSQGLPQNNMTNKLDNYTYVPSAVNNIRNSAKPSSKNDSYSYLPSSDNILKVVSQDANLGKYIPSQNPANVVKMFDNSALESALKRADRAEQRAINVLAGNFE